MKKIAFPFLLASTLAGLCSATGCRSQNYDPLFWHENFVTVIQNRVGSKMTDVRRTSWADDKDLVDRTLQPNGNIAYRYLSGGTCRYIFEVDPNTDIIVVARWEGEARHCILIP